MVGRLAFDTMAALTLGLTAVVGAYVPVYLASRHRRAGGSGRSLTFILLNMFSAGVMVSAGFCHLLGEALKQMPLRWQFPLAPFLCGVGFLLTLVADNIAHSASGWGQPHAGAAAHEKRSGGTECCMAVLAGIDRAEKGSYTKTSTEEETLLSSVGGSSMNGSSLRTAAAVAHDTIGDGDEDGPNGLGAAAAGSGHMQQLHRHPSPPLTAGLELEVPDDCSDGPSGHSGRRRGMLGQRAAQVSFLTAVLMGVALCFHSLLEGAAMGAQETVSNSAHIFVAIVSHKGLAAYALGSSIVDSEASSQRFWSVVLPFTLASPVGIFLGFIASDLAKGTGAASISALASGTFLYVAFMEVIPRELRDSSHQPSKLAMLIVGFLLMSVLAIWA